MEVALIGVLLGGLTVVVSTLWFFSSRSKGLVGFSYSSGIRVNGPRPAFTLGNRREVEEIKSLDSALEQWREVFGSVFQFWLGPRCLLFVNELEAVEDILHRKEFVPRFHMHVPFKGSKSKAMLFGNSWEGHKSEALKSLTTNSYLKGLSLNIVDTSIRQLDSWEKEVPLVVDVQKSFSSLALDIIGLQDSCKSEEIEGETSNFQEAMGKFLTYFDLSRQVAGIFAKKRKKPDFQEFLDTLSSESDPRSKKRPAVIGIKDFIAAGQETTSKAISFALYLVARNRESQVRLQRESDCFSSRPTFEDCERMRVADAVIREALRIFPVVPLIVRRARQDTTVSVRGGTIAVPKGSDVVISVRSLGQDSSHFSKPELFDINRWLDSERAEAWIPFGLGERTCVGSKTAITEAKLILCMVMQRYTVMQETDVDEIQVESSLTNRPTNLKLLFAPRSKQQ